MALEALHKEAKPLGLQVSLPKTKVQVFGGSRQEVLRRIGLTHDVTDLRSTSIWRCWYLGRWIKIQIVGDSCLTVWL